MKNIERYNSPEEVNITIKEARLDDVQSIENFLSRNDIDSLFIPLLSNPARGMTIKERVEKKIKDGVWFIAVKDKKVVGCMAVVPAKLTKEVQPRKKDYHVSEGISLEGWGKNRIWELSTVAVDLQLTKKEKIKGIGKSLLEMAKDWVKKKGTHDGLITDSWVGGDMGGFVMAMNTKEYKLSHKEQERTPNTLMRIYTDPAKRGENGPLTVIYGIPLDHEDWRFLESKQIEIQKLQEEYNNQAAKQDVSI